MATCESSTHLLTVVISGGQSRNPEKRQLEEALAARAAAMERVGVMTVPHLYDLPFDSQTYRQLRQIDGDLVVLSWLFDRATHWTLDRNGIRGQVGEVLLREEPDEDDEPIASDASEADTQRVVADQPRPERHIYCIDFKVSEKVDEFIGELSRILELRREVGEESRAERWRELSQRHASPTNDTYLGSGPTPQLGTPSAHGDPRGSDVGNNLFGASNLVAIEESPGRRWYPVIDFSRCTNCMECIDFCLFGVYGVDAQETILVEQADNCRKGCPACSRVCPQNAIMFPQHKTPAIAGAPVDVGGLKIDLSKLFGAPETDEDAALVASRERDEQLILAGRAAVGRSVGELPVASERTTNDDLDQLLDQLDALDL